MRKGHRHCHYCLHYHPCLILAQMLRCYTDSLFFLVFSFQNFLKSKDHFLRPFFDMKEGSSWRICATLLVLERAYEL